MGLGTYVYPPRTDVGRGGRLYPHTGFTRPNFAGEPCGDHCLPHGHADGPMRWLNEPDPTLPPRFRPSPVTLRGLGAANVVVWDNETVACSMPTLTGFVVFGGVGLLAGRRGHAPSNALNGVWGSWAGCALGSALGLTGPLATALTLAGAYVAARVS